MKKKAADKVLSGEANALYTVINGCDTADGVRYEVGDAYNADDHAASITAALMAMNCIEAATESEVKE